MLKLYLALFIKQFESNYSRIEISNQLINFGGITLFESNYSRIEIAVNQSPNCMVLSGFESNYSRIEIYHSP